MKAIGYRQSLPVNEANALENVTLPMPESLSFAEVAAMPLTSITAWEMLFTRSMFKTPDMVEQHKLLNEVAGLIDKGQIKTTVAHHLGTINAENLIKAHAMLESQQAHGKIFLEGF